jgi:uncharacterized membrane protein HdeD (DUF308 family)
MSALMLILGILLIILGFCCAMTPLATLLAAGYFIAIVLIVSGISGIITGFRYKFYGANFIVSILALILGVLALVRPGGIETVDNILIYLFAAWLLIRGATSVTLSLRLKKLYVSNDWIFGLIIGILGVVLGVYSFIHPSVSAIAIGYLIAFYFIEQGIDVIVMSRVVKNVTQTMDEIEEAVEEAVENAADYVAEDSVSEEK